MHCGRCAAHDCTCGRLLFVSPIRAGAPWADLLTSRTGPLPQSADRGAAAIEFVASVRVPNLLDLTVVESHFETERLAWVGFDLTQALNHSIQIVRDGYDLAAQDSDEFPGER